MPFAIALLCHPIGAYTFLVVAVAGLVYGIHVRRFVSLFTGVSAALLTTLAFLHVPPSGTAVALLIVGAVLLNLEFRCSTGGTAGVLGLAATLGGSWQLLVTLPPPWRAALAALGTALVLLATLRGWRRARLRHGTTSATV